MSKISVATTVSANPEKVWQYWNTPVHITKWNFASDDWQCPSAQIDLRPGGKMVSRMEAKDGSFGFDFEAIYDEVVANKKVSYTMGDGRHAVTVFENQNGQTRITTTFDAEKTHPEEMQRGGWQAILDNFKKYVEANP